VFAIVLGAGFPNDALTILNRFLIYLVAVLTTISGFHYCFTTARGLSS
jgi:hypothetical protein